MASGDFSLDVPYPHQYVQNENVSSVVGAGKLWAGMMEYTPILMKTTTGTIYVDGTAVQTFVDYGDKCVIQDIGSPAVKAEDVFLNRDTGELKVAFNEIVHFKDVKVVAGYEYNLECQPGDFKHWHPNDDMNSLQKLAEGDSTLDLYYNHQYVHNEVVLQSRARGPDPKHPFKYHAFGMLPFEHLPIKGTIVGTIYRDGLPVAKFEPDASGEKYKLMAMNGPVQVEEVVCDHKTGRLSLSWAFPVVPFSVDVVASYEYDYAAEQVKNFVPKMKNQVTIE